MGFQQAISGLNAASHNLDAIGNNVANSTTIGFKESQAQFSDVFASSLTGAGGLQIGIGTKVAGVAQAFTQGNITSSNNPLDMAINGKGFFRLSGGGTISYARNGQFQLDKTGYLVNSNGLNVTGYPADIAGNITASTPVNLQINSSDLSPSVTTTIGIKANLDSRSAVPAVSPFSAVNPATFNSSTSISVYDSLGNAQTLGFYFVKNAAANTWDVYGTVTNPAGTTTTLSGGASMGQLVFSNTSGALTSNTVTIPVITTAQLGTGATNFASIAPTFTGSTQFGSSFGVNSLTQNGYASGRLTGFSVGSDGVIKGRYSNGQALNLGQLVLANFTNPQGLQPLGNNTWGETSAAGAPVIGAPNSGSLGVLQSSALEDSNVDLTSELVNMITAQRIYQANAQTIHAQDQVLQTLVNIR